MITLYETEQELRKDPKTLCAVRDFLLCSNEEIFTILTLLQTEKTDGFITTKNEKGKLKPLSYGYYSFQQPKKKKGEFRTITIPDDRIKEAHTTIALRADKISLSTAAIGGEKGFDIIKNAKYHRYNQYMYAIDLKDAFPSVTTERVYTNISSSLSKIFQYSYPYLKKDQRSLLALTITYIITHLNQLPQGTKTSMKLLNVVMASVDQMVISYIHDPKNFFLDPAYTRYADDAVMSYRDLGGVQEYLDTILLPQRYAILPIIESGSLDELQQIVIKGTGLQQLLHDIFNSNSFSRTSEFAKLLSNIKDKLSQRGTKSNNKDVTQIAGN